MDVTTTKVVIITALPVFVSIKGLGYILSNDALTNGELMFCSAV